MKCLSVFLAVVAAHWAESLTIPCSLHDENLNTCLRNFIQTEVALDADELRRLGLPLLDPLKDFSSLSWEGFVGGGDLRFELTQATLSGIKGSIIRDVKADPRTYKIRMVMQVPSSIVLEGLHSTEAKIFGIPISGHGPFQFTAVNPVMDVTFQGKPMKINGQTYLEIVSTSANMSFKTMYSYFGGLFDGIPVLGQLVNGLINRVAPDVMPSMQPQIENWLAEGFQKVSNEFLSKNPLDKLFKVSENSIVKSYFKF